jgi:hypothetical protein
VTAAKAMAATAWIRVVFMACSYLVCDVDGISIESHGGRRQACATNCRFAPPSRPGGR